MLPMPAKGGRLASALRPLPLDELQGYMDQNYPGFAEQFSRHGRAAIPDPLDSGARVERMTGELDRMGTHLENATLDDLALATSGIPIAGDAVGLAADGKALYDDPSWLNAGAMAFGALPFATGGMIRAYHGSPHDFDKFQMDKIGTGEGAQAYGHGLYFAEAEDTARNYREALAGKPSFDADGQPSAIRMLMHQAQQSGDLSNLQKFKDRELAFMDKAIAEMEQLGPANDHPRQIEMHNTNLAQMKAGRETLQAFDPNSVNTHSPGHMYEVNINAEPDDFLEFDKRLQDQPEAVKRWLEKEFGYDLAPNMDGGRSMSNALQSADNKAGRLQRSGFSPELTNELNQAGIPGIKYLDQGSRAAGEGSRNYVVFDDALIDIIRKYGIAGILGGAGAFGALGTQDEGEQPPL